MSVPTPVIPGETEDVTSGGAVGTVVAVTASEAEIAEDCMRNVIPGEAEDVKDTWTFGGEIVEIVVSKIEEALVRGWIKGKCCNQTSTINTVKEKIPFDLALE